MKSKVLIAAETWFTHLTDEEKHEYDGQILSSNDMKQTWIRKVVKPWYDSITALNLHKITNGKILMSMENVAELFLQEHAGYLEFVSKGYPQRIKELENLKLVLENRIKELESKQK